jgi:hypothetical protein
VRFLRGVGTPRFRSQRFWHGEEDVLLTGARRRLWPGEIDPVGVVNHPIENGVSDATSFWGKNARSFLRKIATKQGRFPRSATSYWIDFQLSPVLRSNIDTRIPMFNDPIVNRGTVQLLIIKGLESARWTNLAVPTMAFGPAIPPTSLVELGCYPGRTLVFSTLSSHIPSRIWPYG